MIAASRLANDLGMLPGDATRVIIGTIANAGLPVGQLSVDPAAVIDAMFYDKKVRTGKVRLVLPDRIGHVVIRDDVPPEKVRLAVESLKG